MEIVSWVLYIVAILVLLFVQSLQIDGSGHSRFELERRKKTGDKAADLALKKQGLGHHLLSLQRALAAVFLVVSSLIGVKVFGWVIGFLVSIVVALESGSLAKISYWQKFCQQQYREIEPKLVAFVDKHTWMFKVISSVAPLPTNEIHIESRDELLNMINNANDVVTRDQRRMIASSLGFDEVAVEDVMTPKSMIDSISANELLGPLVLDDLHKTGHSRFPVIKGDIDHVVGMLYIQDLLTIGGSSKTQRAESAMDKKVFYIRHDQTLDQALAAFLRTRHHLFVVINQYRETVGLLSLEDVIEALLGRKINDEFDTHEDLRKVAERNPWGNNSSSSAKNV